jgi:hypothetical protein
MFLFGGFFMVVLLMAALSFVAIGFAIWSLIDVARAPDAAFGPPWDNGKNAWTLGLALAFVVPFGTIVGPIVWWTQGRPALRSGRPVPRPFWSPRPTAPHPPYVPYADPHQPPEQPPGQLRRY